MRFLALVVAYLLCVAGAVLFYPTHELAYGLFSWTGGVLFVLLVQEFRDEV